MVKLLLRIVAGKHHFCLMDARKIKHGIRHDLLHDSTEPTGTQLELDGLLHNVVQRLFLKMKLYAIHLEKLHILLHQRILRLCQDLL